MQGRYDKGQTMVYNVQEKRRTNARKERKSEDLLRIATNKRRYQAGLGKMTRRGKKKKERVEGSIQEIFFWIP